MLHQTQVEEQQRRSEKNRVDEIQRTANPWQKPSRVLQIERSFENRFCQVADYRGQPQAQPEDHDVRPVQQTELRRQELPQQERATSGEKKSSPESLPGLIRRDVRDHRML